MFNGYLKKKTVIDAGVLFVCLGIVMLLAKLYHPNNLAMHKVSPHPFFIISIVYSAYHGLRFSILSSVATAILYYALLAYQTDFQEVESIFTGAYLVLPLTTTIVSVVIGDIRQRTWLRQQEIQKELGDAHGYVDLLKKEKDNLDKKLKEIKSRLVTKLDTTKSLYDKARGFYDFRLDNLLAAFNTALEDECSIEESQIFLVDQTTGEFRHWNKSRTKVDRSNEEIPLTQGLKEVLSDVLESEEVFSIRDLVYKKDFKFEESPCLVASPIFKDGEVYAIAVVSKMPFLKLTPTNLKVFEMLCQWFGDAIFFSDRYNSLKEASLIRRESLIHRNDYFLKKISESASFSKQYKTELTVVQIDWTSGGFRRRELSAFKNLLAKTLGFLFDGLEIIGAGEKENSLRILLFRSQSDSEKFLSELRDELGKIRGHSGLDRFPELVFSFLDDLSKLKESSIQ